MAWTNVFDVGECSIELYEGLGYADLIPEVDYAGRGITVDTTGGVVTVDSTDVGGLDGVQVRVVPSFDPEGASVRVLGMSETDTTNGLSQAMCRDGSAPLATQDLTGSGDAYEPDPATFTDPGAWVSAAVSVFPVF